MDFYENTFGPFHWEQLSFVEEPIFGGGMEHADSTAIGATWPDEKDPAAWQSLASITAHEFFHLWNVKRIRPQSLEPVDYSAEQPTPSLWFSEGFTSTYGAYTLLRTGLIGPQRFLEQLQDSIYSLEQRPATLLPLRNNAPRSISTQARLIKLYIDP